MISPMQFWYICFTIFTAGFIFVLWRERAPRFLFYAIFGSLLAFFVFETPASIFGFHEYPTQYYIFSYIGIPLSMVIAEGFCIAIAVYFYEKLPWIYGLLRRI